MAWLPQCSPLRQYGGFYSLADFVSVCTFFMSAVSSVFLVEEVPPEKRGWIRGLVTSCSVTGIVNSLLSNNISVSRMMTFATAVATEAPRKQEPYHNFARQAHFVEVEIDPGTGQVEIKKAVIVNDVGRVINPHGVSGQQFGGCIFGVERELLQEKVYDPLTGVVLNANHTYYPCMSMADLYPMDCIAVETALGYTAYGTYGIGENVGCMWATSIVKSAIHNAIGKWIDETPITPDKILRALGKIL